MRNRRRGCALLLFLGLGTPSLAQDAVIVRSGDVLRVPHAVVAFPTGEARVLRLKADSVWLRVRPYAAAVSYATHDLEAPQVLRDRAGVWRRRLFWTGVGLGIGAGAGTWIARANRCQSPAPVPGTINFGCDAPAESVFIGTALGGGAGAVLGALGHLVWERPQWRGARWP